MAHELGSQMFSTRDSSAGLVLGRLFARQGRVMGEKGKKHWKDLRDDLFHPPPNLTQEETQEQIND